MHRPSAAVQCALAVVIVTASTASARPRPVAVVNAASDQDAGAALVERLRAGLTEHPELLPLRPGELARALEEPLRGAMNRTARLTAALSGLDRARGELGRLRYERVLAALEEAETALLAVEPGAATSGLLAQVSFLRAIVFASTGRTGEAVFELRAVRQLDPDWPPPDPARYRPELVQAHADAGHPVEPTATLRVNAPFDGAAVYVNGRRSGTTPAVIPVPPGVYYVTGTQTGDEVNGARVVLREGGSDTVKLRFSRVTVDDRARYLRRQLMARGHIAHWRGEGLRSGMRRAAALTNVETVIVVGDDTDRQLWVTAYHVGSARTTPWIRVAEQGTRVLLAQLGLVALDVLAPPAGPADPTGPGPQPEDSTTQWWSRSWVKAGLALGIIASVVGLSVSQLGNPSPPGEVRDSTCCTVSDGSRR